MDIQITGKNIEVTQAIRDYVNKKFARLDKYISQVIDAHVTLYVERIYHVAVVTIRKRRLTLHGEERSEDLYASIDLVVDKLEKQLRRHKDRIKSHNSRKSSEQYDELADLNLQVEILDGEDVSHFPETPRVIHAETFALKPMSVDEAALQMELMHQDFLVFTNPASETVNVIYRRNDGNYGLVVPQSE